MSNVNVYNYTDNHLYFWFNGRHSSEFGLFIEAKNDLKIENTTSPSIQFNNAMFQEGSYFLGASRTQKNFKRKVAAKGLTWERYREMMLWLLEGTTGMLYFDSNPYWGWSVVLDKLGDSNVWYDSDDTMVVEFDISWKTIGTWMATNRYDSGVISSSAAGQEIIADNPWGLPSHCIAASANEGTDVIIFSLCNAVQYIDIESSLDQYKNTVRISKYNADTDADSDIYLDAIFYTKEELEDNGKNDLINDSSLGINYYGIMNMLFVNNSIAESDGHLKKNEQTKGVMELKCKTPKRINNKSDYDKLEWSSLYTSGFRHVILTKKLLDTVAFDIASFDQAAQTSQTTHYAFLKPIKVEETPTEAGTEVIYTGPSVITEDFETYDVYLVHSNKINVYGMPIHIEDGMTQINVHSYNLM